MEAPPVLTPERIDFMLSMMAEVCLESVVDAGQRQKTADDFESFERCGRSLQRACRNLRQTIALKQRFDREEARKAEDTRRVAQDIRKDAERARSDAVTAKRAQVRRHFDRVLWNEYEPEDVEDLLDDLELRLRNMIHEDDFLETPVETLVQRLSDEIGVNDTADEPTAPEPSPPCGERVGSGGVGSELQGSHPHPRPLPARGRGEADGPPDASVPPPDPPPDPPLEPYVPPWERLGPGQRLPGGSGW
jgi:hypothetical protein